MRSQVRLRNWTTKSFKWVWILLDYLKECFSALASTNFSLICTILLLFSVLILLLILCCHPFLCVSSLLILSAYNKLLMADLFFPFRSQVKWAQPRLSITLITLLSTFRDCLIMSVCVCVYLLIGFLTYQHIEFLSHSFWFWLFMFKYVKLLGFPGHSVVVNILPANAGDMRWRFNPWVRMTPWKRKWQPTPIFLPGKSHRQRSLADYSPWGRKEFNIT